MKVAVVKTESRDYITIEDSHDQIKAEPDDIYADNIAVEDEATRLAFAGIHGPTNFNEKYNSYDGSSNGGSVTSVSELFASNSDTDTLQLRNSEAPTWSWARGHAKELCVAGESFFNRHEKKPKPLFLLQKNIPHTTEPNANSVRDSGGIRDSQSGQQRTQPNKVN
ncbi:hypothetical protein FHETE_3160 [Fusarium heterosporum]|uniref:Uncharacterized protein n=1 Tax=Fusarium heterosporum TaxID=42747 RepID=A0A8H5WXE3_FUSHE|nr:hypothetical protein FHETE_3160 [Fusarium heterosporum]